MRFSVLVLFICNFNLIFLYIGYLHPCFHLDSPTHLAPPEPTAQGVRMPTYRERRISNRRVLWVGVGEAHKGKEFGKELGKGEVKYKLVSEEDQK